MKHFRFALLGLMIVSWLSCSPVSAPKTEPPPIPPPSVDVKPLRDTNELLNSVLWMQQAAEFRALTQMVFRQAKSALDAALADPTWTAALEQTGDLASLPPAVILDIDETVLSNSPLFGQMILDRDPRSPRTLGEWSQLARASAIPGALDFVAYAESKGVSAFFITNRIASQEAGTIRNMQEAGFASITPETLLLLGERPDWRSDKSSRRAFVASRHRVLLLLGDDLGDFLSGAKDSPEKRIALADQHVGKWGKQWIILPNPLYGSWESSLYGNDISLSDEQVLARKRSRVIGFK